MDGLYHRITGLYRQQLDRKRVCQKTSRYTLHKGEKVRDRERILQFSRIKIWTMFIKLLKNQLCANNSVLWLKILVHKISVQIWNYFSQSHCSESVRSNLISPKMRVDEMDLKLMWVGPGICNFRSKTISNREKNAPHSSLLDRLYLATNISKGDFWVLFRKFFLVK